MSIVQPIRDKGKIEQLKDELRKSGDRDFMLAYFGLNSRLRISDYLGQTVGDVRDKDKIYVKEKKTGKKGMFRLPIFLNAKLNGIQNL